MPIPQPDQNESEDEFIGRCMGDPTMVEDTPDASQRAAICYRQWRNKDKSEANMEILRKSFTGVELKKDKPGYFTARIATLNVIDKDGDVTLNGAFPEGKEILISAYQHGSWMGALPVGKGVIHEIGNEAIVDGVFNLNSETGKEHYETVKFSPDLTEWSYGFKILALDENNANWKDNPRVYRVLKSLDIFEASPVLRGAGENTTTLSIKSTDGTTYADQAEAVLAAANDLLIRSKSLADLRKKEGRDLSAANRERLTSLHKSLADLSGEFKTLVKTPEPVDKTTAQKLFLEFSKLNQEILEVS